MKNLLTLRGIILPVVFLFIGNYSFAQFTVNSEFRTKFEYRDGFKTLLQQTQNPIFITSQRTRLNLNYTSDKIQSKISVQDVRVWGDEVYKTDNASMNIYEAWGEVFLSSSISLKIGRQALSYDENRLFGTRNWNDVGASHNLALFKLTKNNLNLHIGSAVNNETQKNFASNYSLNYYKNMSFLWFSQNFNDKFKYSIIGIIDGYQKENSIDTVYYRNTFGGNLDFLNIKELIDLNGEFYYQGGKNKMGQTKNAFFFSVKSTFKINEKINIIGAIDYFSGNDALKNDNKSSSFSKLYGNGHGYYGYMDYFTDVEKHTKGGGLMDIYGRANIKLSNKIASEITYHNFSFTNNVIDINSPNPMVVDKKLGSEIDIVLNYKHSKNTTFKLGYSTIFATESMELLKNGDSEKFAHWAWFMVSIKPEFFTTNK